MLPLCAWPWWGRKFGYRPSLHHRILLVEQSNFSSMRAVCDMSASLGASPSITKSGGYAVLTSNRLRKCASSPRSGDSCRNGQRLEMEQRWRAVPDSSSSTLAKASLAPPNAPALNKQMLNWDIPRLLARKIVLDKKRSLRSRRSRPCHFLAKEWSNVDQYSS